MCGPLVRDGTSTSTIPSNPAQCENLDCNEDREYGMHEDFYSYTHCKLRNRNERLFTADQVSTLKYEFVVLTDYLTGYYVVLCNKLYYVLLFFICKTPLKNSDFSEKKGNRGVDWVIYAMGHSNIICRFSDCCYQIFAFSLTKQRHLFELCQIDTNTWSMFDLIQTNCLLKLVLFSLFT